MFYALFILLFLIIFLLFWPHKKQHMIAFIFVLASYFAAICSMMIYFSRNTYYYNILKNYFYLPDLLWRKLFFFPLSRINVIRFMNFSSLCAVLASVYFALSFQTPLSRLTVRNTKIVIWVYLLLQIMIYDPFINLKTYYLLYPDFISSNTFYTIEKIFYTITRSGNNLLVCFSILILLVSFYHSPHIQLIRYNFLLMTVCFIALSGVYFTFISRVPSFLLCISKFADSYYFGNINLGTHVVFYYVFPFFLIFFLFLICYSLYKLTHINRQIEQAELEISKQIDATETTSKVFCHFIKNELLAIQSSLELLPVSEESGNTITDTITRCENLYSRIDEIHKSTKTDKLHLIYVDLKEVIERTLNSFQSELSNIQIHKNYPLYPMIALADPIYLEQALHNIIRNAIDAMEEKDSREHALTLGLHHSEDWILMEIEDTGTGISQNNIKSIFTPFFSSKPTSRHWGIGLSLTYRIIAAHEGKIEVRSSLNKGTTFQILLPNVTQIFTEERSIHGKQN